MTPFNCKAVCVGMKIIVFFWEWSHSGTNVFVFDVVNETLSEKKIKVVNNLASSSYVKYNSD